MSEVDLESCLGLPDQKVTDGKTTLFMYNANSSHSLSLTIPVIDFVGASFSGYCHATFRFEKDRVIAVHYSELRGVDCSCFPWVKRAVGRAFFAGDGAMMLLAIAYARRKT